MIDAVKLRLHRFTPLTRSEGPGLRACIQVQGCPIRCIGCGVPQTWSPHGGALIDTDALIDAIRLGPAVEGVTFLGGEPFAQSEAVATIAEGVRNNGLSVVTFTGYQIEGLIESQRHDYDRLLDATDLLIDGPFNQDLVDFSRPWVGSRNQRYHFLTERYAGLADEIMNTPNRLEVRIGSDGNVITGGLAPPQVGRSIINALACTTYGEKSPAGSA